MSDAVARVRVMAAFMGVAVVVVVVVVMEEEGLAGKLEEVEGVEVRAEE